MTEDFKSWWLWYVEKHTPEGCFYLPLEAKSINELTPEEFNLFCDNECELIINDDYGIEYFLCKKSEI